MPSKSYSDFIEISRYPFNQQVLPKIVADAFVKEMWPLVYLIFNKRTRILYVGETTSTNTRIKDHLANPVRKDLDTLILITNKKFNKSATLDIESYLIKYLSGDGLFELQNANAGLMFHTYHQRNEYYKVFESIWEHLCKSKLANHELSKIDNSNLFKYSPYKSLSEDQFTVVEAIIKELLKGRANTFIIEGGAGTGKTVLASYFIKLIHTELAELNSLKNDVVDKEFLQLVTHLLENLKFRRVAFVIPMPSLRKTLKRVFRNVKGLSSNMVIGPSEVANQEYDLLVVDEAHRLRQRKAITNMGGHDAVNQKLGFGKDGTELDWVLKQGKKCIFFYDAGQSVRPSDVRKERFESLKLQNDTFKYKLVTQLRVKGGLDYMGFVEQLFSSSANLKMKFSHPDYELKMFNKLPEMIQAIKKREKEVGLSRMVAGFSWEWISRKGGKEADIVIGKTKLFWNRTLEDWINSEGAVNEVGCIHTTQGYDLNYTGIIYGSEVSFDPINKQIIIRKEHYYDKKGKEGIKTNEELKNYILNIYRTIMFRGIKGTYIYVSDPELKKYFSQFIQLV